MSLIVIEGLDGSGKETQANLLERRLADFGIMPYRVSFPNYASDSSALVKMYLAGEFGSGANDVNAYAASSFYAVDRYADFHTRWKEVYSRGQLILADRYTTSNMVFQLAKLEKSCREEYIKWLEDFEYDKLGLPRPDKVIYLDMPIGVSQKLLEERYSHGGGKKDIHEGNTFFLMQCANNAKFLSKKLGWSVVSCSDGEKPRTIEEIHEDIMDCLKGII